MSTRRARGSLAAGSIAVALALAALLAGPAPAQAAKSRGAAGALTQRLAKLAKPAVRSGSLRRQARLLDLAPRGPGSLQRIGARVVVDVRFRGGAKRRLRLLRRAGARVVHLSRRYQTVTVAVRPRALRRLARVEGVEGVIENLAPIVSGIPGCTGAATSEGDLQLHAADARTDFGVDGSGVKVGILSDSFDLDSSAATHADDDVLSGDLPGDDPDPGNPCEYSLPVDMVDEYAPGDDDPAATDEGRAMAQIVHDIAPGASLAFATAFGSESGFADNIRALRAAGSDVIVDDVAYLDEPFFQEGPVSVAVDDVTAAGAAYFSAVGNQNVLDPLGRDVGSWEAPAFRSAGGCPPGLTSTFSYATDCMDFNPGSGVDRTFGVTVPPGATLGFDLQWAEPRFGVSTDLDAYLLDSGGNPVRVGGTPVGSEEDNGGTTKEPFEFFQWTNSSGSSQTVQLAINRFSGNGNPRLKFVMLETGSGAPISTEYPASSGGDVVGPTVFGHAGEANAIAVGAIRYNTTSQPETFSSHGDVTHYFGPVDGTTPAAPIAPQTVAKPDLLATDCGATTFFAQLVGGVWRFCGTSAAAPHAAGVAALQLDADSGASPGEIRAAQTSTADPVGSFGPAVVGAGRLNARAAVAALLPPATVSITSHPGTRTSETTPTFEFAGQGFVHHFACVIDGAVTNPCGPPLSFTTPPLGDGDHVFQVQARNFSNGVVAWASFSFTVDTTGPGLAITQQPGALTGDSTPTFAFGASEPATFTCAFDGETPEICRSPYTPAAPLGDGPHSFEVIATDELDNSSRAATSFAVDTTPPAVAITSAPPALTRERLPTLRFSAAEQATFTCSFDGEPPQRCPFGTFAPGAPLDDGPHTFQVTAVDAVGNSGSASAAFTVDTTAPRVKILKRPPRRSGRRQARFKFASDAGASFECKRDRHPWRRCASPRKFRVGKGRHRFRVRATDAAGNLGPATVVRWRVLARKHAPKKRKRTRHARHTRHVR